MNTVTEKLIDWIDEETGIRLKKDELLVTVQSDVILVTVWGQELISMDGDKDDLEDENFTEELWEIILDEYYDLRERLSELKITAMNMNYVSSLKNTLTPLLLAKKFSPKVIDNLDFEFVDVSSADRDYGLPKIALRVTDFEQFDCSIPIDLAKTPQQLEPAKLTEEIVKKIRG